MTQSDPRAATNPLFGPNRLKLGLFGVNVSNGCAITKAEERFRATWAETLAICTKADGYGYEAMVPVARWKGFGGETNFNGTNFDTYTWAAGIAQATKRCCVLTTSHVPTVHPIMAAKQATTVDHISGGRFALNIVCGWFAPELEMFGRSIMEHDTRYEYAAEWIEVMKLLWTREEEFDFEGKFIRVPKGFSMPKPIQKPFPPLMNAGSSGKGRDFAAKYADMAFIHLDPNDIEKTKAHIETYRRLAREEHGRAIQIWGMPMSCSAPTQEEADDYLSIMWSSSATIRRSRISSISRASRCSACCPRRARRSNSASRRDGAGCRWSARPIASSASCRNSPASASTACF